MRIAATVLFTVLASPLLAQQASVAGTDGTNVLGSIPCAPLASAALSNCPAELLRKGNDGATLRVLMPGGKTRSLYFEGGELTSADTTDRIRGSKQGGTYFVFVGESERFEIPAQALQ